MIANFKSVISVNFVDVSSPVNIVTFPCHYISSVLTESLTLTLCPCMQVNVSEASNPRLVKVSGPAIEKPVKTFEPTYLLVDCSEAGPGTLLYLFLLYGDQIVTLGGWVLSNLGSI